MLSGVLWQRGGKRKRKESLQLHLWNLNICFEKVDAKCWLGEMTLVMTSLPLAHVFQCLFTFALISTSRCLAEIWQLSRRGATGELEAEFKFQRCSCKLSFLFPPYCQSTPESLLAGYLCYWLKHKTLHIIQVFTRLKIQHHIKFTNLIISQKGLN